MTFPWPFQAFQDLRFRCQFQKYKTLTCFRAFFDRKKFNRHKLRRSPKRMAFTLLNYSSLSYIVLAFSSAVNNLSNRTLIFHDFQGPTIKWLSRPGNEILKFHDFPGFPWPVRTQSPIDFLLRPALFWWRMNPSFMTKSRVRPLSLLRLHFWRRPGYIACG